MKTRNQKSGSHRTTLKISTATIDELYKIN
jgi:hypothetical protein